MKRVASRRVFLLAERSLGPFFFLAANADAASASVQPEPLSRLADLDHLLGLSLAAAFSNSLVPGSESALGPDGSAVSLLLAGGGRSFSTSLFRSVGLKGSLANPVLKLLERDAAMAGALLVGGGASPGLRAGGSLIGVLLGLDSCSYLNPTTGFAGGGAGACSVACIFGIGGTVRGEWVCNNNVVHA